MIESCLPLTLFPVAVTSLAITCQSGRRWRRLPRWLPVTVHLAEGPQTHSVSKTLQRLCADRPHCHLASAANYCALFLKTLSCTDTDAAASGTITSSVSIQGVQSYWGNKHYETICVVMNTFSCNLIFGMKSIINRLFLHLDIFTSFCEYLSLFKVQNRICLTSCRNKQKKSRLFGPKCF